MDGHLLSEDENPQLNDEFDPYRFPSNSPSDGVRLALGTSSQEEEEKDERTRRIHYRNRQNGGTRPSAAAANRSRHDSRSPSLFGSGGTQGSSTTKQTIRSKKQAAVPSDKDAKLDKKKSRFDLMSPEKREAYIEYFKIKTREYKSRLRDFGVKKMSQLTPQQQEIFSSVLLASKRPTDGKVTPPPKLLRIEQQEVQAVTVEAAAAKPFVMPPFAVGERCAGGCGQKPRVPRVFCHGIEGKQHILCANCLERRHEEGLLYQKGKVDSFTCPIQLCDRRLESRELAAATRGHAYALHAYVKGCERHATVTRQAARNKRRLQQ